MHCHNLSKMLPSICLVRFRELADMLGDLLEAKEKDYIKVLGERYATDRRMTGDILQWMASPDYQVKNDWSWLGEHSLLKYYYS